MVRHWWRFFSYIALLLMLAPVVSAQEKPDRFQVGGHFGLLITKDRVADRGAVLPEYGGTFGYSFLKYLGLDTESSFYPARDFAGPVPGDLVMQQNILKANFNGPAYVGLFGGKAGIKKRKIGIFVKARPGVAVFHLVYNCPSVGTEVNQCREVRKKEFAMDLGAVIEVYLSRRAFVRFDTGDTYLRFGKTSLLFRGSGLPWISYTYAADPRHQFHLKIGVGFPF